MLDNKFAIARSVSDEGCVGAPPLIPPFIEIAEVCLHTFATLAMTELGLNYY
ncbi:MAG: hypothetical protein L3V56_08710 [Candidatus Magnetoovum sp. WYHC-5]|nr:hypothetical protein [Candidatus Magnetoovum sp. WYHC-5]